MDLSPLPQVERTLFWREKYSKPVTSGEYRAFVSLLGLCLYVFAFHGAGKEEASSKFKYVGVGWQDVSTTKEISLTRNTNMWKAMEKPVDPSPKKT